MLSIEMLFLALCSLLFEDRQGSVKKNVVHGYLWQIKFEADLVVGEPTAMLSGAILFDTTSTFAYEQLTFPLNISQRLLFSFYHRRYHSAAVS